MVFGVSAELLSLREVVHTLEKEADGTLGRKAIVQLIRAHCATLVDLAMLQTLESLPISTHVGGRRTNSPAKRLRSGEIVDDVVENAFESFVERVAESGTYARLVQYFGEMAQVVEPVFSDCNAYVDHFHSAVNEVKPLNELILEVCAMFNLPTIVINTTEAQFKCTALMVHPSVRRREFANGSGVCGTFAVRLEADFLAVSDREKLAIGFVVGLLGVVPCATRSVGNEFNERNPGPTEVIREPAWINIVHHP